MSGELWGVVIGGVLGITSSLVTTLITIIVSNRRRTKAIRAIAQAEITAIKEKAERFIAGQTSPDGFDASKPLLASLASELGFLSVTQAVALRRAVTLDMEMRKEKSAEKAHLAVLACEQALSELN